MYLYTEALAHTHTHTVTYVNFIPNIYQDIIQVYTVILISRPGRSRLKTSLAPLSRSETPRAVCLCALELFSFSLTRPPAPQQAALLL